MSDVASSSSPKKILVLGATSGIAEATCRIWASQGASLFLVARNAEKRAVVSNDLRTRGAAFVETAVADLDDTAQHPALLAHAVNSLQGLDVAYLAHGVLGDQAVAEQDFNAAAHILHTNFIAPVSLVTWLSNRLGRQISTPDLTEQGFTLVGGRLLPPLPETGTGPAAQLLYQNATANRLTVYITAAGKPGKPFETSTENGVEAYYWANSQITCTVVGDLPSARVIDGLGQAVASEDRPPR